MVPAPVAISTLIPTVIQQPRSSLFPQQGLCFIPQAQQELLVGKVAEIHLVRDFGLVSKEIHFAASHLDRVVHHFPAVEVMLRALEALLRRPPGKRLLDILDQGVDQILPRDGGLLDDNLLHFAGDFALDLSDPLSDPVLGFQTAWISAVGLVSGGNIGLLVSHPCSGVLTESLLALAW